VQENVGVKHREVCVQSLEQIYVDFVFVAFRDYQFQSGEARKLLAAIFELVFALSDDFYFLTIRAPNSVSFENLVKIFDSFFFVGENKTLLELKKTEQHFEGAHFFCLKNKNMRCFLLFFF
jgi:hypothetical protein